jgi:hypothetical protein
MIPSINPTQSNVQAALRSFLLSVLPSGTPVVAGQQNRIPESLLGDFVVMTPIRFERLATNLDSYFDDKLIGSIIGNTMTITSVFPGFPGQIGVGSTIFGSGVTIGTKVTALGSGSGGAGTYIVSPSQSVGSEILSGGSENVLQPAKVTVQLDFHSANDTDAGDMAQTVATLLGDDIAVQQFVGQIPNYGVIPLYAEDPRQMPFLNAEQQYEWRWVVEAMLQANVVVQVPQQFADSVVVGLIDVDEKYPAT